MRRKKHRRLDRTVVGVSASSDHEANVHDAIYTFDCSHGLISDMDYHRIAPELDLVAFVRLRSDRVVRLMLEDQQRLALALDATSCSPDVRLV